MKKKITTKLFSLSCENHATLLTRIIEAFSRPGYAIETFSQSRTDVSEIILITLEVTIPAVQIDHMILRLKRIIGVLEVTISFGAIVNSALFTLNMLHCISRFGRSLTATRPVQYNYRVGNSLFIKQVKTPIFKSFMRTSTGRL